MKKTFLAPIAEKLYIVQQYTIDSIASELSIAEKTVRLWKADGNWEQKRTAYLKTKTEFHEDLYNFARKLMKLISLEMDRLIDGGYGDEEQDKRIESRINSMTRLLGQLPKTKDYESKIKEEKLGTVKVSGDEISNRVHEILNS